MEDCIFCKIVKGEIPADKVYEDSKVIAFLDINPVNKGHVLVIPKEHYHWMYNVPDNVLGKIFIKSKGIMGVVKNIMNADYVAVAIVGLDVPHFHIHLVPRYKNDGMANFWPTKKYKEGESKEFADKIKIALELRAKP